MIFFPFRSIFSPPFVVVSRGAFSIPNDGKVGTRTYG
jgi:hypothetical protein